MGLLQRPRPGRRELDAIVVPASRPAANLDTALRLGAGLGAEVVVLCSKQADSREVMQVAAGIAAGRCTVVDVPDPAPAELRAPKLRTSEFKDAAIHWHGDLSLKRNLGLGLGRALGWSTLLFLDDDIRDVGRSTVQEAVDTLEHHAAAGLRSTSHPDNSAVCHARRLAFGDQDVFVGGSALAVDLDRVDSFFPQIYNEDWLFLAPYLERREVAAAGTVRQKARNPYSPDERVAQEEFGDVIGEGLLGQLHVGRLGRAGSGDFWSEFLDRRAEFIEETARACRRSKHRDAGPALAALATAERRRAELFPETLADYVAAWMADLATWRRYLSQIARRDDLPSALRDVGLHGRSIGPRPAGNTNCS